MPLNYTWKFSNGLLTLIRNSLKQLKCRVTIHKYNCYSLFLSMVSRDWTICFFNSMTHLRKKKKNQSMKVILLKQVSEGFTCTLRYQSNDFNGMSICLILCLEVYCMFLFTFFCVAQFFLHTVLSNMSNFVNWSIWLMGSWQVQSLWLRVDIGVMAIRKEYSTFPELEPCQEMHFSSHLGHDSNQNHGLK